MHTLVSTYFIKHTIQYRWSHFVTTPLFKSPAPLNSSKHIEHVKSVAVVPVVCSWSCCGGGDIQRA